MAAGSAKVGVLNEGILKSEEGKSRIQETAKIQYEMSYSELSLICTVQGFILLASR